MLLVMVPTTSQLPVAGSSRAMATGEVTSCRVGSFGSWLTVMAPAVLT